VEVVRRYIEEFANRDELPSIVHRFWDTDADYYPVRKFPEAVPRHGREEVARFIVEFRKTWDRFEMPIKELIPVGDDRVLAITTQRAVGPTSGISLEGDLYCCAWLRHGLIFRWEDHLTLAGALHAFGFQGDTLKAVGLEGGAMADESTTPDPVELSRRAFAAASRRDLDALMTFYASDAVVDFSDAGLGTHEGVDAIRALFEDWFRSYAEYETTADEILRLGENVVLTINTQTARLSGGSGFVQHQDAYVLLVEDGLVARLTPYRNIDEARAAAERLAEERG
jgi:ketosteroid isomerase-like protein